jgi:hypothetical protein
VPGSTPGAIGVVWFDYGDSLAGYRLEDDPPRTRDVPSRDEALPVDTAGAYVAGPRLRDGQGIHRQAAETAAPGSGSREHAGDDRPSFAATGR